MDPAAFLRGNAFPGAPGVPYPRARADDAGRMHVDTWTMAQIPVGVRLELEGDAEAVEIAYRTATDDLGYRGDGAGRSFDAWRKGVRVGEVVALLGEGRARVPLGDGDGRVVVYLPEGMKPEVLDVSPLGGDIAPAPPQPRWVAYGDSVAEGWIASAPALAWPAIAARDFGLDVVNMGYAGAARGEIVSAEHVAALPADVVSITHGTNCWTRIPHTVGMFRENLLAFLETVRASQPETPILIVSPIVRPDAERSPNRLGATLADLRRTMEEVASERAAGGDGRLRLIAGLPLVDASLLGDGIHPNDHGHAVLAAALGPMIRELAG